jgi:NADH:ubiquinone oxidoreductase subunit E
MPADTNSNGQISLEEIPLILSLQIAQKEAGYLSPDTLREIAKIFKLSPNKGNEIASFAPCFSRRR